MDRIIEIKVGGNHISKDSKNAGVRGEANVTQLRISFDKEWEPYAKKVTFWDARGLNPVEITLTTDKEESAGVYLIPIPGEPMAEAGMLTFVIDGFIEGNDEFIDGKRHRSMSDTLEVKDAPIADNAGKPADPTPTQAEQLQTQIDGIITDIREVAKTKAYVEQQSFVIDQHRETTLMCVAEANASAKAAEASYTAAKESELKAKEYCDKAEEISKDLTVIQGSYVGNGTFGSANRMMEISLRPEASPVLLFLSNSDGSQYALCRLGGAARAECNVPVVGADGFLTVVSGGSTVLNDILWWSDESAKLHFNESGKTYYYKLIYKP